LNPSHSIKRRWSAARGSTPSSRGADRERNRDAAPVNSWADHDRAVSDAWAAPGVTRVKDHILAA
jgi:hypothetical protein